MLIDLSVQLDSRTPAYPGDPEIHIEQSGNFDTNGCLDHLVRLGTHTGTHIDAPAHMLENGAPLGAIPLDHFKGKGKLIETFSLDAARAASLEPDDIVLFSTKSSERYYEPSYFTEYPVMSLELADFLVKSRVKLVGLDTCSADNKPDFPIHKILLKAGIPIIENLTNVTALKNKNFFVYAFPLKLNLDGAPARVVAEV